MPDTPDPARGATPFPPDDRGLAAHWRRVGPQLEARQRAEARAQGQTPYDWRIIDSLLQLGYENRQPNPPTGLIAWQRRLREAYEKRGSQR